MGIIKILFFFIPVFNLCIAILYKFTQVTDDNMSINGKYIFSCDSNFFLSNRYFL